MKPLFLALMLIGSACYAQDKAPNERAQRQVDNVFKFMHITTTPPKAIVAQKPKQEEKAAPKKPTKQEEKAIKPKEEEVAVSVVPEPVVAPPKEEGKVVEVSQQPEQPSAEESPLLVISQKIPEFPDRLIEKTKGSFTISIEFYVNVDGSVSSIDVKENKYPLLTPYVVESVKTWQFEPIKRRQLVGVDILFNNEPDY